MRFKFASLQSAYAEKIIKRYPSFASVDSIILLINDQLYTKSTAVLKICRQLKGWWSFFYIFIVLPKSFRDWIYDIIAAKRYQWFGKSISCMIPDKALEERFFD